MFDPPSRDTNSPPYVPPAGYSPPVNAGPTYPMMTPQPYQPVVIAKAMPTSGWAIAALIFGIFSVLAGWCTFAIPSVAAVICGHAGLRDTNGGVKSGRGMAIAGLILGYPLVALIGIGLVTGTLGSLTG